MQSIRMISLRRCAVAAAAVAASLLAAACNSDADPTVETPEDAADTTTTSTSAPPATTAPATDATTAPTSPTGPEAGQRFRVAIKDSAYNPAAITVKPGVVVTWTNEDAANHTVTADDGSFDYSLSRGRGVGKTFSTPGTYAYHCSIHPSMKGTVTVQ